MDAVRKLDDLSGSGASRGETKGIYDGGPRQKWQERGVAGWGHSGLPRPTLTTHNSKKGAGQEVTILLKIVQVTGFTSGGPGDGAGAATNEGIDMVELTKTQKVVLRKMYAGWRLAPILGLSGDCALHPPGAMSLFSFKEGDIFVYAQTVYALERKELVLSDYEEYVLSPRALEEVFHKEPRQLSQLELDTAKNRMDYLMNAHNN